MNQGTVAGAGIAAHLHQHIVPRWGGDTNFMPVVGHTKVLPQLLADTRKMLAEAWPLHSRPASEDKAVQGRSGAWGGSPRDARPHRPAPAQPRRPTRRTASAFRGVGSWTAVLRNDERLPNFSVSTPFSSRTLIAAACTTRSTGVAARSASSAMKRCRQGWSAQACRSPNGSGSVRLPPSQFSSGGYQVRGARGGEPYHLVGVDQRQLDLPGLPEPDRLLRPPSPWPRACW